MQRTRSIRPSPPAKRFRRSDRELGQLAGDFLSSFDDHDSEEGLFRAWEAIGERPEAVDDCATASHPVWAELAPLFEITGFGDHRPKPLDQNTQHSTIAPPPRLDQLSLLPRLVMEWEIACYLYSAMPEKSTRAEQKEFWVAFYTTRPDLALSLEAYQLRLRSGELELKLNSDRDLSWAVCGHDPLTEQELWQIHLAFVMPSTTHDRAIFQAELVHVPTGATVELGPSSFVSNSGQRKAFYPVILGHTSSEAQAQLVCNFRDHHGVKHRKPLYKNGKGKNQESPGGLRFLFGHLSDAVHLPISFPPSTDTPIIDVVDFP